MNRSNSVSRRIAGLSLIELMVAMAISLVASLAMIMLMANTLSTSTRNIAMTRLTQELRTAMQIISRDLRRANYIRPQDALTCVGDAGCLTTLSFAGQSGEADKIGLINIADSDGDGIGECLSFWLDRDLSGSFENLEMGAFRFVEDDGGTGSIEVLTSPDKNPAAGACPTGVWLAITDPDFIDVQSFEIDDTDTYIEEIATDPVTGLVTARQTVQKISLFISADLIKNGPGNSTISREIGNQIRIRNNFTSL